MTLKMCHLFCTHQISIKFEVSAWETRPLTTSNGSSVASHIFAQLQVPIGCNGTPHIHPKMPLPITNPNYLPYPWTQRTYHPKGIHIQWAVFAQYTRQTDGRLTDKQTDRQTERQSRWQNLYQHSLTLYSLHSIIDFPSLGITYNGGWCSATMTRWNS